LNKTSSKEMFHHLKKYFHNKRVKNKPNFKSITNLFINNQKQTQP